MASLPVTVKRENDRKVGGLDQRQRSLLGEGYIGMTRLLRIRCWWVEQQGQLQAFGQFGYHQLMGARQQLAQFTIT